MPENGCYPLMKAAAQRLIPVLVICAGLYAYHNSLQAPFIFDDLAAIPANPSIRHLWPLRDVLVPPPIRQIVTRPTVNLSLAVNYALGGLNVWGYHVFNVTVLLLGALVLYGVARRTLLAPGLYDRYGAGAPWLALAITLIWVVHPLQTESVTYTLQRTEVLMGLFFLLTLYCVIRSVDSPHPNRWQAAAMVSTGLGMGSKEVMIVAPLVVLGYDWIFLSTSFRDVYRRRWTLYAGLAAILLIFVPIIHRGAVTDVALFRSYQVTSWGYAKTQAGVIVHYLQLAVWPAPLVGDYDDWPLAGSVVTVLPCAMIVVTLLVATIWTFHRRLPASFLGVWFFLILAPSSSFWPLPTEFAAERRMYLPLAAVIALIVIGGHTALRDIWRRLEWRTGTRPLVEIAVLIVITVTLAQVTVRRNEDYKSAVHFWSDVVAKRPSNARGHNNLGIALANQGKFDEAIGHYSQALQLNPSFPETHRNWGDALAGQGKFDEAVVHYSEALQLNPSSAETHNNLGVALASQGKLVDAIAHYSQALTLNPNYTDAHNNLRVALVGQGNRADAILHSWGGLQLNPSSAETHNSLGNALASQGKFDEAISHYSESLRLNPDSALAHRQLGVLLAQQGRLKESIAHFSEVVRLAPSAQAHYNLGFALVRDGNVPEAIRSLETALKIDPAYQPARRLLENLKSAQ